METSLEQELREVQESVREYLVHQPDADALAACAFLMRHVDRRRNPWRQCPVTLIPCNDSALLNFDQFNP
jgi:hypothetical protein